MKIRNRNSKQYVILTIALTLMVALTGCSSAKNPEPKEEAKASTEEVTETEATEKEAETTEATAEMEEEEAVTEEATESEPTAEPTLNLLYTKRLIWNLHFPVQSG